MRGNGFHFPQIGLETMHLPITDDPASALAFRHDGFLRLHHPVQSACPCQQSALPTVYVLRAA